MRKSGTLTGLLLKIQISNVARSATGGYIAMDPTFNPDPSDQFYPVVSPSLMKPEWSDRLDLNSTQPFLVVLSMMSTSRSAWTGYQMKASSWMTTMRHPLLVSSAAPESPPPKRSKLSLNRRSKFGCSSAASTHRGHKAIEGDNKHQIHNSCNLAREGESGKRRNPY